MKAESFIYKIRGESILKKYVELTCVTHYGRML